MTSPISNSPFLNKPAADSPPIHRSPIARIIQESKSQFQELRQEKRPKGLSSRATKSEGSDRLPPIFKPPMIGNFTSKPSE